MLMKNGSIRQVLALTYFIATLILTISVTFFSTQQIVYHIEQGIINDSLKLAERLSNDSRLALIQMADENVRLSVKMAKDFPNIEDVTIYSNEGDILIGEQINNAEFDSIKNLQFNGKNAQLLKITESHIYVVAPVFAESYYVDRAIQKAYKNYIELIGYVLVIGSRNQIKEVQTRVTYKSVLTIALISIILLFASMYILGRVTNPLKTLSNIMLSSGRKKSYSKAPVQGVKEIRELTIAFNEMVSEQQQYNKEIIRINAELEKRVLERTKDLEQAHDLATKYNKENRALITGMNKMLEEERRYVARELHDHLNAELVAIKLALNQSKKICTKALSSRAKTISSYNEIISNIDDSLSMVSRVYESSRGIVRMLHPEVIDSLGLVGALEDTISTLRASHPECSYHLDVEGNFTSNLHYDTQIAIFRVVQESLTNSVKHSKAKNVNVSLQRNCKNTPHGIYLCVDDDGIGFDVNGGGHKGIGILSMRERIYALGGNFDVKSEIGSGTTISAKIPENS